MVQSWDCSFLLLFLKHDKTVEHCISSIGRVSFNQPHVQTHLKGFLFQREMVLYDGCGQASLINQGITMSFK